MLVLSRMVGQEIVVPACNLVLSVLEVRGDRVRLGIAAPGEVAIYRREVWERIRTESPCPEGRPPGVRVGTAEPEGHDPSRRSS